MSDIAKWALLAAGAIGIIGLILALPFAQYIDIAVFTEGILTIVNVVGDGFKFGRGLINNLFSPFGRSAITGLMLYWIGKWVITLSFRIFSWIYHFLFK